MKLIETTHLAFIILECYSTAEDIQQTFEFTVQANDFDRVTDKNILHEIEQMSFCYDFDKMTIKLVERDFNDQLIERELEF